MGRYVGATEAARRLGVQRATLYAYVSRGVLERRVGIDGRSSLFDVDELEALATRRRRPPVTPQPSIDVQITTAITALDEDGPRYRGHDVALLSRTSAFEDVAELLWTGELVVGRRWPPPAPAEVARVRAAIDAVAADDSTHRRVAAGLLALAAMSPPGVS
ncbi:MAG: citrate synthase, partial [Acidimicrobiales bacterium]|nr:citrate synthase [Acidimicrobiales bacterium]